MSPARLKIEDLQLGAGKQATERGVVQVHYVGRLADGSVFDSSRERGQTFTAQLGCRQVIAGWDQGIPGMKQGGVRKLTIPPGLAYGSQGFGDLIPPRATLEFEIELVRVLA